MDVEDGVSKYDEYHRGVEREVITVNTRIKSTNKGFAMLAKLGWVEGQPLGLSGDGRVDPVPFYVKNDLTGLGKTSQDVRMIETTVAQRRGLDSERQRKETEEQRKAREEHVARRTALQSEISSTLRPFYCTLCDKQFKTVTQYDEHTNSYAHHHKARLKDMQANARIVPKEELDKRKEKERKREERELRKIAAANGIKMPKPSTGATVMAPLVPPASSLGSMVPESATPCDAPKKFGGWVSVSASSQSQGQGQPSEFKRPGWSTVGGPSPSTTPPSPSNAPPPPPPSAAPPTTEPPSFGGDWPKVSSPSSPPSRPSAPAFRTGGWTLLSDDSLSPAASASPPPPPSEWSGPPPRPTSPPQITPQTSSLSHNSISAPIPAAQPVRSGWQQFKHSGPKRR
ncbi:hypothetical protein AX15_005760 [Amanita polypyramis BW_CC]|nr:hypothetical protein AX15_005760 [Amanita polypyramis BW_CC]